VRRRVFCASLADIFDAEVPDAWRGEVFDLVGKTPHLDWLLLTKRPQVAKKWAAEEPLPANVWLGTTVENQAMADLRIPILLSIPATKRFLSCEPLLGPLSFRWSSWGWNEGGTTDHLDGLRMVDWIIAGGESGPGARPMHPDWARTLRDECQEADVPFFFKQWGEYAPCELVKKTSPLSVVFRDGHHVKGAQVLDRPLATDGEIIVRAGKAIAGATLDGREWREFPTTTIS
jgi:protein gp37